MTKTKTKTKTKTMHASTARKYVTRWHSIQNRRAKIGLEEADLLAEVRSAFPLGPAGDLQFREWAQEHLDAGNRLYGLLRKATAKETLGGALYGRCRDWPTVACLLNYEPRDRRKLVRAINLDRPNQDLTKSRVRATGYKLNLRSVHSGAPRTGELHAKVDLLIDWIFQLYDGYEDLPVVPAQVREAMSTSSITKAQNRLRDLRAG